VHQLITTALTLCLLLARSGEAAPPSESHLVVVAAPVSSAASAQRPVLIRVTLLNDAPESPRFEDAVFFVLVKRLTFGSPVLKGWPYLHLDFEITDPDGKLLVPPPIPIPDRLALPQLDWFDELHAGEFFGRTIPLQSEWIGYRFAKLGRYRVRARISTDARIWLDEWLRTKRKDPSSLPFSYEHVFGGTLLSEPTVLTIAE
jgi:hypothetical protein